MYNTSMTFSLKPVIFVREKCFFFNISIETCIYYALSIVDNKISFRKIVNRFFLKVFLPYPSRGGAGGIRFHPPCTFSYVALIIKSSALFLMALPLMGGGEGGNSLPLRKKDFFCFFCHLKIENILL